MDWPGKALEGEQMKITVGISNRHAHLTQEQIEILFGKGYALTFFRKIKQPDEFASNERIDVIGPRGALKGVRIMGPAREKAQVEIPLTKAREIGVEAQIRASADVAGSSGVKLVGPAGACRLEEGVIAAARHLHMSPAEAERLGLRAGQRIAVETGGDRGLVFKNVLVRIDDLFSLEFHIDTDEANAAGLNSGDEVKLAGEWAPRLGDPS
jgi:putative phosphotransacetylase